MLKVSDSASLGGLMHAVEAGDTEKAFKELGKLLGGDTAVSAAAAAAVSVGMPGSMLRTRPADWRTRPLSCCLALAQWQTHTCLAACCAGMAGPASCSEECRALAKSATRGTISL
jgi:hypothetical protein